jgi:hypothetical protein
MLSAQLIHKLYILPPSLAICAILFAVQYRTMSCVSREQFACLFFWSVSHHPSIVGLPGVYVSKDTPQSKQVQESRVHRFAVYIPT